MLNLVVENCAQGMCIKPWRRQDICASLPFEEKGEPQRHAGTVGWIQRFYTPLCMIRTPVPKSSLYCTSVYSGVVGHTYTEELKPL